MKHLRIPNGKFAADDAALKAKRAALKEALLKGKPTTVGGKDIPVGKLAADDAALKAKRAALKEALLKGKPTTVGGKDIPVGKLAAQWYDSDPMLLQAEKEAMRRSFPNFELGKLDDGRMYWLGDLHTEISNRTYTVMAVYNNNHPEARMGSSVRVYPILPDVDDLIEMGGYRPSHLLPDDNGEYYLCTTEADYVHTGSTVTTAATVLRWALKWFVAYDLVMSGDLTREQFNKHHGI